MSDSSRSGDTSWLQRWALRSSLMTLLVAVYVFAWSPARDAYMVHGAGAAMKSVCASEACAQVRTSRNAVTVKANEDGQPVSIDAPAGVRFLLPALFILAIAPRSPYWLYFFGGHVALTTFTVGLAYVGIAGSSPVTLYLARFASGYLLDGYSLTVPALLLARRTMTPATSA
jgi:hypothetical protein